jgi:hypothetical protein
MYDFMLSVIPLCLTFDTCMSDLRGDLSVILESEITMKTTCSASFKDGIGLH